jgi:hypothetical protein
MYSEALLALTPIIRGSFYTKDEDGGLPLFHHC